jgi:hypothetical protein
MLPTIRFVGLMIVFTLLAGFFIVPTRTMPDNAIVLLDDQTSTYLSPKCAKPAEKEYRLGRAEEARQLNYQPEKNCRAAGGFSQENRSMTGNLLARLGLLPPAPNRWNPDGTWNW